MESENVTITFLNVDLDLDGPEDLRPIAAHFEACGVFKLHVEPDSRGGWFSRFEADEVNPSDVSRNPDAFMKSMLDAVESLPVELRTVWDTSTSREFNIGYECGDTPWAFNQGMSNETLKRMADAGMTLRITLYPPDRGQNVGACCQS